MGINNRKGHVCEWRIEKFLDKVCVGISDYKGVK